LRVISSPLLLINNLNLKPINDMDKYIVSYVDIKDVAHRTEVNATCEANAIAQIQFEGHKVLWACLQDMAKVQEVNS
jgi:hypothetical protein